jgi:hypothetical protein
MYGPDAKSTAGWNWANAVLDFNRDDYYRANVQGCPDLSNSPYLAARRPVSVTASGPGTVTSTPAGIDCPAACTGMFQGSVTLTATPFEGAIFNGWTGACSGTATCVVSGETSSVAASFGASSHERTLTLRIRAQRATGTLRVVDGYEPCRTRAPIIVERRSKRGWSITRRVQTNGAGLFTVSIPRGRATYRARVPQTSVNGHKCVKALSRAVGTSG